MATLFSDDELLHVLSEIDGVPRASAAPAWGMAVDVVQDDESLEDLMSSLGGPDDSDAATASSSSPPPSVASTSPERQAQQARPTAKPSRKRRKHELDHLRGVAAALETKLKALTDASSAGNHPGGKYFWKRVSQQLMVEKQKAMGENARLREILRDQVKVVKSLQRSLAKSPDLRKLGIVPESKVARNRDGESSKERYQDLFRHISSSYTAMETMFEQAGMPAPSLDGNRKINMEMQDDGNYPRMCIQIVESRMMPYKLLHVGEQAWKFLTQNNGIQDSEFKMSFDNSGDDLYGECKLHCDDGPLRLVGDVAMRRYVEDNRLAFVWECAGVSHTSLLRVQQKGWCMIEPASDDPENSTLFRACVRITPIPVEGAEFGSSSKEIGSTTESVLDNYERTVVFIFDQIFGALASET